MQIVILCGGRGTRLKNLTKKTPKPMLLFNGKPFLERLIEYLYNQGFNRYLLLCGYKSNQFKKYFIKNKYNLKFSTENKTLGTGGAIKNAFDLLDDNFILINGDSFLPENYNKFKFKLNDDKKLYFTIYKNKANDEFSNNLLIKNNKIIKYSKLKNKNFNYIDAGVYLVKKEIFKNLKKKKFSFEEHLFNKLIKENKVGKIETKKIFFDIGTKKKLYNYRKKLIFK